jgi:hypothetical protein
MVSVMSGQDYRRLWALGFWLSDFGLSILNFPFSILNSHSSFYLLPSSFFLPPVRLGKNPEKAAPVPSTGAADTPFSSMHRVATILDLAEPQFPLIPEHLTASPAARAITERQRALFAGLSSDEVVHAVAPLFHRLSLRAGESLLEVGPGPQGGIGLIAALLGLHVVFVERDDTAASPATAEPVRSPIQQLVSTLEPFARLVRASGGSIKVVPGDFSDARVQAAAQAHTPIHHVVCTDVMNASGADAFAAGVITTGDTARNRAMLAGLANAARHARTVYTSTVGGHCSDDSAARAVSHCRYLEQEFRAAGRRVRHRAALCPGSGSVCRAHLYQLS